MKPGAADIFIPLGPRPS